MKRVSLIVGLSLCLIGYAWGDTKIFSGSEAGIISDGDIYDTVVVEDSAVLNMTGGLINKRLIVRNSGAAYLYGGIIENIDDRSGHLLIYDNGIVTISGNVSIREVESYGNSEITMNGGTVGYINTSGYLTGGFTLRVASVLYYYGGSFSNLYAYDNSVVNVHSGVPYQSSDILLKNKAICYMDGGTINNIEADEYSELYIAGGSVNDIGIYYSSKGYISGGNIKYLEASFDRDGHEFLPAGCEINIYGTILHTQPYGGTEEVGYVNGYLYDDSYINASLDEYSTYAYIILHEGEEPPLPDNSNEQPAQSESVGVFNVNSCSFKQGKKPGTDSLALSGKLDMQDGADFSSQIINVYYGEYETSILNENLNESNNVYKYQKPKGLKSGVMSAIFDLNNGDFSLSIKNVDIGQQASPVTCSITFNE